MPKSPNYGGSRPGAGRLRQRYTLDQEHARYLRELVTRRSKGAPRQLTADEVLSDLVMRAYMEEVSGNRD